MSEKQVRNFPLKFKHEKSGGVLIARNETQASAFEKQGFVEVTEKKK